MFHFHDKILILAPWIHMLYYFAVFSDLFILTTSLTAQHQDLVKRHIKPLPVFPNKNKKIQHFWVQFYHNSTEALIEQDSTKIIRTANYSVKEINTTIERRSLINSIVH